MVRDGQGTFQPVGEGASGDATGTTLRVLFQDDDVLALDKPPGVVVIPARGEDPSGCLHLRAERERGERLWVVHRIDRDTSGVVLFARNANAHRALNRAFEARLVRKRYVALTRGAPPWSAQRVDTALHQARKGKMRPALPDESDALAAVTEVRVLDRRETSDGVVGLVEARPETGRQHQIRVHLRSVGAPLLHDGLYGGAVRWPDEDRWWGGRAPRLTLHAASVSFSLGTAEVTVESPLADDLAALWAALASRPG